jgi:hypothetical protein
MPSYKFKHQCYKVSSRSDLRLDHHQTVLHAAAKSKTDHIYCDCRSDHLLRLIPHFLSGCGYILRREHADDPHLEGCCFAGDLEAVFEPRHQAGTVRYTLNMLLEKSRGLEGMIESCSAATSDNQVRYGDFIHFFQRHFTRASVEAFAEVNVGKAFRDPALVNPEIDNIFARLAEIMSEPLLQNDLSVEFCLRSLDLKLFWGLTMFPLVEESDRPLGPDGRLEFELGSHWECDGFHEVGPLLEIPPDVLLNSRGKAKANDHIIPPPYLYAALAKPNGDAYRAFNFYRIPVAHAGEHLFPVESEIERRGILALVADGIAMLKLHVQGDMRALGSGLWPFKTDEDGYLPNRPDVIAFTDGGIQVLYIAGMDDPEYQKDVDASVAEMERHFSSEQVLVRKIQARSLSAEDWRRVLSQPVALTGQAGDRF